MPAELHPVGGGARTEQCPAPADPTRQRHRHAGPARRPRVPTTAVASPATYPARNRRGKGLPRTAGLPRRPDPAFGGGAGPPANLAHPAGLRRTRTWTARRRWRRPAHHRRGPGRAAGLLGRGPMGRLCRRRRPVGAAARPAGPQPHAERPARQARPRPAVRGMAHGPRPGVRDRSRSQAAANRRLAGPRQWRRASGKPPPHCGYCSAPAGGKSQHDCCLSYRTRPTRRRQTEAWASCAFRALPLHPVTWIPQNPRAGDAHLPHTRPLRPARRAPLPLRKPLHPSLAHSSNPGDRIRCRQQHHQPQGEAQP
jgi:hypothetical protein